MPGLARICARTTATRRFGTSLPRQALLSSLFGRAGNTKAENNGASDTRIQDAPRDASSFTAPLELAQKSRHRPPTLEECKFVRKVGDGSHPLPEENPGARVHLNLLSVSELESLEGASRDLCRTYGIDLIDPLARAAYMEQMQFLRMPPNVNMLRVTGRPEHVDQKRGEWGYGDEFDPRKTPEAVQTLIERIQNIPGLALGRPRDLTINQRRERFFRLDPHLDPEKDGGSIFILSLTAGTVITLSPLDHLKQIEAQVTASPPLNDPDWKRGTEYIRSTRSYTPHDLDVLAPLHSVCQLSDDARWTWTHATRLGVEVETEEGGRKRWRLADWWGNKERIVPREEERISVVVAFGDP